MYICSYALFLKEMLMFRYIITVHLVMNSFGTLFHDKIFSLTVNNIPDISLTFPGFPDKWSPCFIDRATVSLCQRAKQKYLRCTHQQMAKHITVYKNTATVNVQ